MRVARPVRRAGQGNGPNSKERHRALVRLNHWVLEALVPEVWVINARHMRNVPGRKTDVADAVWGASLLEHGLVRPSFIPPEPFRALRDLTRATASQ